MCDQAVGPSSRQCAYYRRRNIACRRLGGCPSQPQASGSSGIDPVPSPPKFAIFGKFQPSGRSGPYAHATHGLVSLMYS